MGLKSKTKYTSKKKKKKICSTTKIINSKTKKILSPINQFFNPK